MVPAHKVSPRTGTGLAADRSAPDAGLVQTRQITRREYELHGPYAQGVVHCQAVERAQELSQTEQAQNRDVLMQGAEAVQHWRRA